MGEATSRARRIEGTSVRTDTGNGTGERVQLAKRETLAFGDGGALAVADLHEANGHRPNGNGSHGTATNGAASAAVDGARGVAPAQRLEGTAPWRWPGALRDSLFRRLLALADMAAAAGGLAIVGAASGHGVAAASLLAVPLIVVLAKLAGRYDHDQVVLRKSTLDEVPNLLVLAAAFTLGWSAVAFPFGVRMELGGSGVVALWAATAALLILMRGSARALAQVAAPPERALIVGPAHGRAQLASLLACDPGAHVEVAGFLPFEDERRSSEDWGERSRRKRQVTFDDLDKVVSELQISRVFLMPTGSDTEATLEAVRRTTQTGAKVSIVPRLFEVVGSSVEFDVVGGVTVLGLRPQGLSTSSRLIKRTVDVCAATLGLLVLAPFGLVVAALIKLDTAGPVFFRQPRIGKDGRMFQMIKFRSMVDGAQAQREELLALNETDGVFKLTHDPRVTRVGRFLRRSSLDELPQLLNVLNGDMSLVGPRPLVADEDVLIEGRHRDRSRLSPGMTGLWQVLGPPRPPLSEMVKADYLYATHWSLWSDTKIVLRTLAHVVNRRGQ